MNARRISLLFVLGLCVAGIGACDAAAPPSPHAKPVAAQISAKPPARPSIHKDWTNAKLAFGLRLAAAAEERATHVVTYDAAYLRIPYPMGDVPASQGVCSDEVVRAYRLLGIDLQRLVHEDMVRAFGVYPTRWGMKAPDANIDHRRVPNLATFFKRHGSSLTVSSDATDYKAGDIVAWALPDGRPHIGIVTEERTSDGARPLVLHNIGLGPHIEDMLFVFKITGHFRYDGPKPLRRES
jgi:uncharacterized protein YijF (DUF1287 family)